MLERDIILLPGFSHFSGLCGEGALSRRDVVRCYDATAVAVYYLILL